MTQQKAIQKANLKAEKLNEYIRKAIQECGGEHDLYLDNSSTIEGSPEYVEPIYIVKQDGHLYAGDTELCRAIYLDEDGEWYEDWELEDMLKWEKACVRKGVRYFKEYNPELDEDDAARARFLDNL